MTTAPTLHSSTPFPYQMHVTWITGVYVYLGKMKIDSRIDFSAAPGLVYRANPHIQANYSIYSETKSSSCSISTLFTLNSIKTSSPPFHCISANGSFFSVQKLSVVDPNSPVA